MMAERCNGFAMLARLMMVLGCGLWGVVPMVSAAPSGEPKPHVILLLHPIHNRDVVSSMRKIAVLENEEKAVRWRGATQRVRVVPNRHAFEVGLLHGKHPLSTGAVGEADWRRKPVSGESLADYFAQAGYTSVYVGSWAMGGESPYDAKSRGFKKIVSGLEYGFSREWLMLNQPWDMAENFESWRKKKQKAKERLWQADPPLFMMVHVNLPTKTEEMVREIGLFSKRQWKLQGRATHCILMGWNGHRQDLGESHYHMAGEMNFFHYGKKDGFAAMQKVIAGATTDWEAHHRLKGLLGNPLPPAPDYRFFHQGQWLVHESPDKFRHRGSLVVGKGYALVDGLKLFKANDDLLPDLQQPLDIAEHVDQHREMLTSYSKWWAGARKALHNPRPFDVGLKNNQSIRLTARDWRPTKIIHADGSTPSSRPVIYQKDLLDLLKGMEDEKYRLDYPAHSGSWSVRLLKSGRYKVTASLLPLDLKDKKLQKLGRLRGGRAFFRLGENLVEVQVSKGATAVSVSIDADAGVTDLECWFTGQLALERELGAFFVVIERLGDKKYQLEPAPRP